MDAVGSGLNLLEPFTNQTGVMMEMVHEFAPIATMLHDATIDFQIEGSGKHNSDLNNSNL